MSKLKHIGGYVINPASIAYLSILTGPDGLPRGTRVHFNAYAGITGHLRSEWRGLSVDILGKTPVEVMDFINDEPAF